MRSHRLAVFSSHLGLPSETFIRRHMAELLPEETVAVVHHNSLPTGDVKLPCPCLVLEEEKRKWRWVLRGAKYTLGLSTTGPVENTVERYLKHHGVEVILSEYLNLSLKWFRIARRLGMPFFAHAHGYDVSKYLRNPDICRSYLEFEHADGIITVSDWSRKRLLDIGLSGANIHVLPCGVDVPDAPPVHVTRDTVRCLMVGRMVPKKAPLLALESFREALAHYPGMTLDVVGDGELMSDVRRYVLEQDLGNKVMLHGSQPNSVVQKFMRNTEIFFQHSRTDPLTGDEEGLPVSILEAMANALPVVSTRHAGVPEAVIEGATGYLVNEGNTEGMSADIVRLARDPGLRESLGQAGWQRAKQHFSWEQERSRLLALMGLAGSGVAPESAVTP